MAIVRLASLLTVTATVLVTAVFTAPPTMAAPSTDAAAAPTTKLLRGDLAVHDPALMTGGPGENWYVFSSGEPDKGGGTIAIRSSPDGKNWTYSGTIWDKIPTWLTDAVPGANNMWAPDIYRHDGVYYLYYAVSTLGHNNSIIALATNTTLDSAAPNYKWVDRGQVMRSLPASNFNAIDAGIVEDGAGTPWMVLGSYWTGIQIVQLEWPSGKRSSDKTRRKIADRKIDPNSVEGSYVVPHGGWYYLFTSWDRCCQGVDSTYRIVIGRSRQVTGPYLDRDGRDMADGGGTTLLASAGNRIGPGGQSASGGFLAWHYYDATAGGAPRLGLRQLSWTEDGWPDLTART
jgi:arabinan endo-1,5-alpha-L-arabinosidase